MQLGPLLAVIILWIIGLMLVAFGCTINNKRHRETSIAEYTPILGGLNFFSIIFSLTIGVILKILPWWFTKTIVLIIGGGIIVLGLILLPKALQYF